MARGRPRQKNRGRRHVAHRSRYDHSFLRFSFRLRLHVARPGSGIFLQYP